MPLTNKSVLVLGLGETGLSLVRWLSAQGARVRAADSRDLPPSLNALRTQFPETELHCGVFRSELLNGIDLIAISPGIPLSNQLVVQAVARGIPVMGDIELFAQSLPQDRCPKIIAITGANGKSTVTSMVGAMCRAAGLDTEVAGNISPAVLDVLLQRQGQQPDVWVLELSSFQLETTSSLSADAATVLNISEDHLDRYSDINEYIAAKARIFRNNGQKSVQVLNRDDENSAGMALSERIQNSFGLNTPPPTDNDWGIDSSSEGVWLMHGQRRVMNANELRVAGLHNVANALAALALCHGIDLPLTPSLNALRAFEGLPHRVQPIAEINDIVYYDDSKGTNVGATIAALQGLRRPAVLIAGGEGKGQDFVPLYPVVMQYARAVVLIGRDADKIAAVLQNCGVPVVHAQTMVDAVRQSASLAQPGDAVLLSPACASFDMFRNYNHRAEAFIAAVHALQGDVPCSPQA
ncbi:UDP-N-acetylmuramoyl-L-alanine--D-glutamate ligase [Candidatus Nitrotoga sp. AM1P]|uniref:UDP-N-acetylmuramoyl-L-alanine--D-glutamate ligase n=1 Tax=Candidatus Nitrotoga sp. AM1P TaxID=2559597 RepID=UPI0010B4CD61|nr:UDP-N-acetylmuramoyl-L-alanine--D-glutamate ligase [Candidatus Nitrotoga sp. AM1P]BBJ24028.1 UDP-N-acetylmuramoylalanine--D-glutamate ligase [Candidatus Nitrotoga sp. AM1P]